MVVFVVGLCVVLCCLHWYLEPFISQYTVVMENAAGPNWSTVCC